MRKIVTLFTLVAVLYTMSNCPLWAEDDHITCNHKFKKTSDNFFPAFRLVVTPELVNEDCGFSALGEIGSKNYRGSGTLGLFFCEQHRFKLSSEFLGQKLHYKFGSGSTHHWVHQWALGGTYQYRCGGFNLWDGCQSFDGIQLHAIYSRAHGHHLRPVTCRNDSITVFRHIDAGRSYVIEGGAILTPWHCAELIISLGYDHTHYHCEFHHKKALSGLAGSVEFAQYLCCDIVFNLQAEFRRPYNYIEALLGWNRACRCGEIYCGIFGSHTFGKCELPSSSAVGGELRYTFGVDSCWKSWSGCCDDTNCLCVNECLSDWLARPAVYMPEVLAIGETHIKKDCFPPTAGEIANFSTFVPGDFTYDVSSAFNGQGKKIVYSQTGIPSDVGGIDPTTGIIIIRNYCLDKIFEVTITGTTVCGSVSRSFKLDLPCKYKK